MYRAILKREVDPGGLAYWVGRLDSGESRSVIAQELFLSYESNARRVDVLYADLLGRGPDAGGRDHWANYLASGDDIILAALLAGSAEYFAIASSK